MTTEIVLPDGSKCNPWIEDCPVGQDGDDYQMELASNTRMAAYLYGLVTTVATVVPPVIYFADRKAKLEKLVKNDWYKTTWLVMWIGHICLFGFPGLLWPVSFAAISSFNSIYLMWQQYATMILGSLLAITISGLYAFSYF